MENVLLDEPHMMRTLARIAHEIIEHNDGCEDVILAGIERRGVPLAEILAENLKKFEGVDVPIGTVDITLYRDDLTEISDDPAERGCKFPCSIEGKKVVLVDDVLYTGRTVRSALNALMEIGRPKSIQLAVLIDRGHRELPVRADFVGKNVPTSREESVKVSLKPFDPKNSVAIF